MILAPYYVVWAFTVATLLGMTIGLVWLVFHQPAARLVAAFWPADGVALWVGYAALYHTLFFFFGRSRGMLADPPGLLIVWGLLSAYLLLRLPPWPFARRTAALALALVSWGFCIGAGYQFIDVLERDGAALNSRPGQILASAADLIPLRRAAALIRLPPEPRAEVARLLARLESGRPLAPQTVALARSVLFPQLLEHFRRDLAKLRTYQIFQILLLGGVLLVWGFGTRPVP